MRSMVVYVALCWCVLFLFSVFSLFPFIGHTGISDSRGVMHDFQGSYYVYSGKNGMAFGPPTRYLKIDIGDLPGGAERWVRQAFVTIVSWMPLWL